ncbi:MAG: DUF1877 family protein [Planctomycetaceae bacterium]
MNDNCTLYEIHPEESELIASNDPEQFARLRHELHGEEFGEGEIYIGLLSMIRVLFLNADQFLTNPDSLKQKLAGSEHDFPPREALELGQAWHGLHYILTGEEDAAEPPDLIDFLIEGGDHWDWGDYGFRYYTPKEVHRLTETLNGVPEVIFKERYQPEQMQKVYPREWNEREDLEWLVVSFVELRAFMNQCQKNESGIVITLN